MSLPYSPRLPADRPIDPQVLHRVLARLHEVGAAGKRPLVIFDLDSTLLDNRPRQARIIREFGAQVGNPTLEACGPEHLEGWSLLASMRACGLSMEESREYEHAIRKFWRRRFFTSEYCIDDIALTGAVDFIAKVQGTGAHIVYCTGRDISMESGTVSCMAREGFPVPAPSASSPASVHLLMKPHTSIDDDEWKRSVRDRLIALGHPVAAFDNEPTHINIYREHFPEALCIHLATDESARGIAVHPSIPSIFDFKM